MPPNSSGGGSAGQTLTISQLMAIWIKEGGSKATAPMAAAVAMAESSGETAVTSPNPDGGQNVGPWQLDTKGEGAGHSVAQLQDPYTNARITVQKTNDGANWGPWETVANGAYRQFLPQANSLIGTVEKDITGFLKDIAGSAAGALGESPGAAGALGQLLQLPSQITDFFSAAEAPLQALMWWINPAHWMRIIAGIFGVLLALAGLWAMGKAA